MRMIIASAAVVALSLTALSQTAAPVKADSNSAFLKRIAGSWKGHGKLRRSAKSSVERVSCRLNASWQAGSKRLHMNYSCRGVDITFNATGTVGYNSKRKRIVGSWSAPGLALSSSIGRVSGNSVAMTLTGTDPKSGKRIRSSFRLSLSGGSRMSSILNTADPGSGKRFRAFSVSWRR